MSCKKLVAACFEMRWAATYVFSLKNPNMFFRQGINDLN